MKKTVSFVSKFRDAGGRTHWATGSYNRLTGVATSACDNIFGAAQEQKGCCLGLNEDLESVYADQYEVFQVENGLDSNMFSFIVRDTLTGGVVAGFNDIHDACEFCESKNVDFNYNSEE